MTDSTSWIDTLSAWNDGAGSAIQRRPRIPSVDHVAMLCMLLDPGGGVRWANTAAATLGGDLDGGPGMLGGIVHPTERTSMAALLEEVHRLGRAEGTVRLIDGGEPAAARYLQLVVTRAGSWRTEVNGGNGTHVGLVVQGWDVTGLVGRIHELEVHSFRDPLTGLANRLTFAARLDHEIACADRSGRNVAVLFATIDHFSAVTDVHGRDAGDQVLVALARRLSQTLRPGDTLARVGSDEFAVICPDLVQRGQALTVVDRLRDAAAVPTPLGDHTITITLSISLTFAVDSDRDDAGSGLLGHADQAIGRAKHAAVLRHEEVVTKFQNGDGRDSLDLSRILRPVAATSTGGQEREFRS